MAGYSQTPLIQKLGIKSGFNILLINAPDNYATLIDQWPENINILDHAHAYDVDFIHLYTQEMAELETEFPIIKMKLRKSRMLWISWPKGKSRLPKELNENDVRRIGLENGLVDIKVFAFDEDWSGLKFMYRKMDR